MKKIIGIVALAFLVGTGAFAQNTVDLKKLSSGFSQFSSDMAKSLPFASTMGLNWSWAYIGNFPHFGVGASLGTVFVPDTGFNDVASAVGYSGIGALLPQLNNPHLGIPLPAYTVEGRLGGFILPFDVGVKVGLIPPQLSSQLSSLYSGMKVDFHLYGIQGRYQLVKEKKFGLRPEVSVGLGFNHYDGNIGVTVGNSLSSPTYTDTSTGNTYQVTMSAPNLYFKWNSNSLDATVEVSKHVLLLFTPYVGAGLSYGFSSAGGGVDSTVNLYKNGSTTPDTSSADYTAFQSLLAASGQTNTFSSTQFDYTSTANGWTARAFGGISVNIFFVKIDGTVMYNVMTNKIGLTLGTRVQF